MSRRVGRLAACEPSFAGGWLLMGGALGLMLLLGLGAGSTGWQWPLALQADDAMREVVWQIRAPRTLGTALLGALLGLAGALAQGLFRNPLAEPYLLGSSSGAALCIALVVVLGGGVASAGWLARLGLTGAAFVGALGGVMLTLALARGAAHTLRLLLAGVVTGVVLGAFTQLMMVWSGEAWRTLQAFMLGQTGLLGWPAVSVLALAFGLTLPAALVLARMLDVLALGEDTARTLGVPIGTVRFILVSLMALATAAAVAQAGLLPFVGLVAPHLVRHRTGGRHRTLLPAAALMGALLMLAADVAARVLMAPQELPVGVLTAVLGGGYLLWQLSRRAP